MNKAKATRKERIIKARQTFPNWHYAQIGEYVDGVSKQYVCKVLKACKK